MKLYKKIIEPGMHLFGAGFLTTLLYKSTEYYSRINADFYRAEKYKVFPNGATKIYDKNEINDINPGAFFSQANALLNKVAAQANGPAFDGYLPEEALNKFKTK